MNNVDSHTSHASVIHSNLSNVNVGACASSSGSAMIGMHPDQVCVLMLVQTKPTPRIGANIDIRGWRLPTGN